MVDSKKQLVETKCKVDTNKTIPSQPAFTCSKSTIETPQQCLKSVQS